MNTDQAKEHLIKLFKPEYHRYIRTQLAGDFAVTLVKKFEEKKNKKMQTDACDCKYPKPDSYNSYAGVICKVCGFPRR